MFQSNSTTTKPNDTIDLRECVIESEVSNLQSQQIILNGVVQQHQPLQVSLQQFQTANKQQLFLNKPSTSKQQRFEISNVQQHQPQSQYLILDRTQQATTSQSQLISIPSGVAPNTQTAVEVIDIRELESTLDTIEGRKIVEFYKQHNTLNEATRQELVTIIIRREANKPGNEKYLQISSTRFQQMTKEIQCKFPNELPFVYFRPYSRESGLTANGKLFSKYENYKKKYLLTKSKSKDSKPNDHNVDLNDDIVFLKNNILPLSKIEQLWINTFDLRMIEISENKTNLSDYLAKYPCLRTAHGYQLLESDFDQKYPDKAIIFKSNCDVAFFKIFQYILKQKIKDAAVQLLINNHLINPNLVTLLILPTLFKITYGRKRNGDKTLIKHTKKEICDSFVLLIPVSIFMTNAR